MKRAIVLLTFNEIEAMPKVFDRIPRDCADALVAVDGGSKDGTREWLEARGVRVLGQPRRGRGVAFREAVERIDAETFVFFSPDGNEDPGDIPKLFALLDAGHDLAIASRMMTGAFNEEDVHWFRPRKWVNQAFTLAANLLWNDGPYVTDTINGFRGVRRESFKSLGLDADGFVIEFQMSIRAMKRKLKIAELPTHEGQRLGGVSTAESWPTGVIFVKQLCKELAAR